MQDTIQRQVKKNNNNKKKKTTNYRILDTEISLWRNTMAFDHHLPRLPLLPPGRHEGPPRHPRHPLQAFPRWQPGLSSLSAIRPTSQSANLGGCPTRPRLGIEPLGRVMTGSGRRLFWLLQLNWLDWIGLSDVVGWSREGIFTMHTRAMNSSNKCTDMCSRYVVYS